MVGKKYIDYEILQEAMEEGLRMSGWRVLNLCEQEKIWTMNEWMNVTID